MRFGTPEVGCEVVCKVTVLVDGEYATYTGRTLEGIKSHIIRKFPGSTIQVGNPVWVTR